MTDVTHQKVNAGHLKRNAYLYVRQSTLRQVFENTESTKRQYGLRQLTSFDLKSGSVVQNFDVSPDGRRIVFDRLRNHADIVLMNLAR